MASVAVEAAPAAPAIEQSAPAPAVSPAPAPVTSESSAQPAQVNGASDSQLHRLCAEGDVLGVRAILRRSLELLESIGALLCHRTLARSRPR